MPTLTVMEEINFIDKVKNVLREHTPSHYRAAIDTRKTDYDEELAVRIWARTMNFAASFAEVELENEERITLLDRFRRDAHDLLDSTVTPENTPADTEV